MTQLLVRYIALHKLYPPFFLVQFVVRDICNLKLADPPFPQAGVWYKHLDGGFPVQGVRFGGVLKSVPFGLLCRWSLRFWATVTPPLRKYRSAPSARAKPD
jgi:hypothetical protein